MNQQSIFHKIIELGDETEEMVKNRFFHRFVYDIKIDYNYTYIECKACDYVVNEAMWNIPVWYGKTCN